MAESLFLKMPTPKKSSSRRPLRGAVFAVCIVAALSLSVLCWWWLAAGRVASVQGMVDGMVYMVSPEFSARLESLYVSEGDMVAAGQPVGLMDAKGYARQLGEAGREAASLRPPDMEEMNSRLRQAVEAEKNMVEHLAQARHEEEARRRQREERVNAHVRAQLQLRSLDSQGGERAAGKSRYAAALRAEAEARSLMESAKVEFERVSRMRAAQDQELGRIRDEVLRARQWASRNRYAPQGGRSAVPLSVQPDSTLYAPVEGQVLQMAATPGQVVQRGEAVLLIIPAGSEAGQPFWVQAYFPLDAGKAIAAGQGCDVLPRSGGTAWHGTVDEVLAPQSLPAGESSHMEGSSAGEVRGAVSFLPVRIKLDSPVPDSLTPGTKVDCVVRTRHIWGLSALHDIWSSLR